MGGVVKRADVKEDKDGKSRGMGTVTYEQSLEAVQAICILHKGTLVNRSNVLHFLALSLLDSGLSHVQWTDAV